MSEDDALDIKSETKELTLEEQDRLKVNKDEMSKIWLKEETKAKQRLTDRYIKEGDRNTACFHVVANQRRGRLWFTLSRDPMALPLMLKKC